MCRTGPTAKNPSSGSAHPQDRIGILDAYDELGLELGIALAATEKALDDAGG